VLLSPILMAKSHHTATRVSEAPSTSDRPSS
jgi:hypothetical protein